MTSATATHQSISPDTQKALEFSRTYKEEQLKEVVEFLRIPSVSTLPDRAVDVAAAAKWLALQMDRSGLENVQVIQTKGHPLVYGDWLHAGPDSPAPGAPMRARPWRASARALGAPAQPR